MKLVKDTEKDPKHSEKISEKEVEEAFIKNYTTGTIWDPPLWVPYSSMLIGSMLMIIQYIAEIIKLFNDKDFK